MRRFYIFIRCELGRASKVASRIVDTVEATRQVHAVSGAFNLFARFCVTAKADIGRFAKQTLQTIDGVADTPDRGLGEA